MKTHPPIDYSVLRQRLVAYARRRVSASMAEDLAQEALLLALQKQPHEPLAYAFGIIKKLIRRATKMSQRSLLAEVQQPLPAADEYLDQAEDYGRLSAALEQALVWGNEGKTILTVSSVSNARIMNTVAEYVTARCTLEELPYTRQHRARLRKEFDLAIAGAFKRCEFKIDPNYRQRMRGSLPGGVAPEEDGGLIRITKVPLSDAEKALPYEPPDNDSFLRPFSDDRPAEPGPPKEGTGLYAVGGPGLVAYHIKDPLLRRALDVVLRFSKIHEIHEGLVVAERAVLVAAEKLDLD